MWVLRSWTRVFMLSYQSFCLPKELSLQALRKQNYDTGFQHHSLGSSCVALAELASLHLLSHCKWEDSSGYTSRFTVRSGEIILLFRLLYIFYVNEYYAYMYISVPCVPQFSKAQKELKIPHSCSYRCLWEVMWILEIGPEFYSGVFRFQIFFLDLVMLNLSIQKRKKKNNKLSNLKIKI